MPQLRIVDLSTYKAYSQELAIGHRDIAGFKWGDKEVIQTGARSDAAGSFLWAIPYEDSSVSGDVDHAMKQREVRLAYLQPRASERFADEDAQYEFCEAVIEQLIARLLRDKRGYNNAQGEWVTLSLSVQSIRTAPIEHTLGATRFLGYELRLQVMDNANLVYDATKWDS